MTLDVTRLSAGEIALQLRERKLSVSEIADAFLNRIEKHDSDYGCFLTVDREITNQWVDHAQKLIDSGNAGPLTGVPFALKDNMSTKGMRTTCASRILDNYVPPYDAHVVEKMRGAGMVLLGKTNLDEFAMGTSTENSAFQLSRNPWDRDRSPGGSSGGSAAAVAAEFAPLSLGSDTGGSIRQPASLCGIVGFKPTYGRVSRYGLVAFASSLDQIGPFSRNVSDSAALASVISGHDRRDSTSIPDSTIRADLSCAPKLSELTFGIPEEIMQSIESGEGIEPGLAAVWISAIDELKTQGAKITRISLPTLNCGVSIYYIIAPAEASSNLARFDGVRFGPRAEGGGHIDVVARTRALFGHEVKARIMIGTYVLSAGYYDAFYVRAIQARNRMAQDVEQAYKSCDAIIMPTSPVVAFKIGELSQDPMALKLLDFCTIPANLGGFPGISLNCGFSEGLPVGLQLMGPIRSDERLLEMAYSVEQALPNAIARPPVP